MTLRYRRLDADGDMTFGHGQRNFLIDTPETVAQSIMTRLNLFTGEWFVNLAAGTPWLTDVVGAHTLTLADSVIRNRILSTFGVLRMDEYDSEYDPRVRSFTVHARVTTIFGETNLNGQVPVSPDLFTLDVSPLDGDNPLG